MYLIQSFIFAVTLAAHQILARSDLYDFGNLPPDHILWGPQGSPFDNKINIRAPIASASTSTTSTRVADSTCTNGPATRACWSDGYSVDTDFDDKWPTTGQTKSYNLVVTNTTCNPDGHGSRICLLINDQYPGPTIEANWGDYLSITVTNSMQDNGTGLHWHGVRQLNSNIEDGTNGLTECPIAPGQTQTYLFHCTQHGTSWYHSHYTSQYGDGVLGPLVINGPASLNYDVDLGPISINDWYYKTDLQINYITGVNLQSAKPPPPSDNILINGMNKDAEGNGNYSIATVTQGKTYRLRIINISADNALRFSIDNHTLQVITTDFVPIKPVSVDSVVLGVGQRYDVVISANQATANYWIRATVENACDSSSNGVGLGIFSYSGAPTGNPSTQSTATNNGCNSPEPLTPWAPQNVGNVTDFQQQAKDLEVNIELPGVTTNNKNIVTWGVNMSDITIQWDVPTLTYVMTSNTSYPVVANVIELPSEGIWVYWIIQETQPGVVNIPHPMHLHGHDFYVLGTGTGTFNFSTDPQTLTYTNPTRRDTTMLPTGGWLALAFPTDNPGAWLFHCHIAWHISEGLGVQFLEAKNEIQLPGSTYNSQCSAWDNYYKTAYYKQIDSGL